MHTFDELLGVLQVAFTMQLDFLGHFADVDNIADIVITTEQLLQLEQNILRLTPVHSIRVIGLCLMFSLPFSMVLFRVV